MANSVTVTNKSGATQGVAIFVRDNSSFGAYSLVWQKKIINDNGSHQFSWVPNDYGLGWGKSPWTAGPGLLFTRGEPPKPVYPDRAGGANVLPVQYQNGDFYSGNTYHSDSGKLEIITDKSFSVRDSLTMSVALYINQNPALIMQGKPDTSYMFDSEHLSYWLTVTNAQQGVIMPVIEITAMSMSISTSTPTAIEFSSGISKLSYILDGLLSFNKAG